MGREMTTALRTATALKEWDAVVAALEQGHQALLIRKGGLDDPEQRLPVPDGWFWLYPTLFHERAVFLREEYHGLLVPGMHRTPRSRGTTIARPGDHPRPVSQGHVALRALARVEQRVVAPSLESLRALTPRTVWTEKYPTLRYRWRPQERPLVLVLRVAVLAAPVEVAERPEYGGCRSVIELLDPPDAGSARQVWDDARIAAEVGAVRRLLSA